MSLEETSEQVIDQLMESLQQIEKELLPYQLGVKPMVKTEEQEADLKSSSMRKKKIGANYAITITIQENTAERCIFHVI